MFGHVAILVLALALLIYVAERAVDAAEVLSKDLAVSTLFIGVTVVGGVGVVDPTGTLRATGYMLAVSTLIVAFVASLGRVGRPAGVACVALYLPLFVLV